MVRAKLGEPERANGRLVMQTMDAQTCADVATWQRAHHLQPTGEVDPETWAAMFPGVSWGLDRFQEPVEVGPDADRAQRVAAMIDYARAQVGAGYVWGAAGDKARGFDCSGLVKQAMLHAGIRPGPVNPVDHQRPHYPTAAKLAAWPGFAKVPASQAQAGDLLFYGPSGSAAITHVALVADGGRMVEAIPSAGVHETARYTSYRHGEFELRELAARIGA